MHGYPTHSMILVVLINRSGRLHTPQRSAAASKLPFLPNLTLYTAAPAISLVFPLLTILRVRAHEHTNGHKQNTWNYRRRTLSLIVVNLREKYKS
jgi:hypothetical protein